MNKVSNYINTIFIPRNKGLVEGININNAKLKNIKFGINL
jgi:hypothetical protein